VMKREMRTCEMMIRGKMMRETRQWGAGYGKEAEKGYPSLGPNDESEEDERETEREEEREDGRVDDRSKHGSPQLQELR
jgi:hypothetical protein